MGAPGNQYFSERFGVSDERLSRALSLGLERGGDFAEAYLQHKEAQSISYEDGKVSAASVTGWLSTARTPIRVPARARISPVASSSVLGARRM